MQSIEKWNVRTTMCLNVLNECVFMWFSCRFAWLLLFGAYNVTVLSPSKDEMTTKKNNNKTAQHHIWIHPPFNRMIHLLVPKIKRAKILFFFSSCLLFQRKIYVDFHFSAHNFSIQMCWVKHGKWYVIFWAFLFPLRHITSTQTHWHSYRCFGSKID